MYALLQNSCNKIPHVKKYETDIGDLAHRPANFPRLAVDKVTTTKIISFDAILEDALPLHRIGRIEDARASYQKLLVSQPSHSDALHLLATSHAQLGSLPEAVRYFERALQINDTLPSVFVNKGITFQALKRFNEALLNYNSGICLNPGYPEAFCNRGNVLQALDRFEEALQSYKLSTRIKPHYAEAFCNQGNALQAVDRFDEALVSYGAAISMNPEYAEFYNNRGTTMHEAMRCAEALADFDRATLLNPENSSPQFKKSLVLLSCGHFAEGWSCYEKRINNDLNTHPDSLSSTLAWLEVNALETKRLLVLSEQGLGDSIQFARYLPRLTKMGLAVTFSVQRPLVELMKTLRPGVHVVCRDEPLPQFDASTLLMSLPHLLMTSLETIPADVPYLSASPQNVSVWRERLGPRTRSRIGLAWSGSPNHQKDSNRSIHLSDLLSLVGDDFEWHSLQKEYRSTDMPSLNQNSRIRQHQHHLRDFADTAALVECMDLIISVDTSVAHLAGAMNKPTWVLLPYVPDFRWMLDRQDSPWYPSVKLFRQSSRKAWGDVIQQVRQKLRETIDIQ